MGLGETQAREFWESFRASADRLRGQVLSGSLDEAFKRTEAMLQHAGLDVAFELTSVDDDAYLILTPEGDVNQAEAIDQLLSRRPRISGWRFSGRRQRKHLSDALTFVRHIYGIDLSRASFRVTPTSRGYAVEMHVDGALDLPSADQEGLLRTFLDHALGEDFVMANVASAGVFAGGPDQRGLLNPEQLVELLKAN